MIDTTVVIVKDSLVLGLQGCAVFLMLLLIAFSLRILIRYIRWYTSPLNNLPGPANQSFWSGTFREIRKEPFMAPHKRWIQELGGYEQHAVIHYSSLLGSHSLLILDKEIVRTILTAPAGTKKPRFYKQGQFLKNRIGDGLVTLEGLDWMRHRRILQPSFTTSFLKDRLGQVVPPKVELLTKYWKQATGREIDVASHMSALTLDVVGDVLFSHEFRGLQSIQEWAAAAGSDDADSDSDLAELSDPFIRSLIKALKPGLLTIMLTSLDLAWLDPIVNARLRETRRVLEQAVDQVIAHAMSSGKMHSKSLLHLMMEAEDPDSATASNNKQQRRLSHQELRNETNTFLMAGHETTSTWLYWALFVLAKHPEEQERLYRDVVKHAPDDSTSIGLPQVEQMEYLHAFLQEVLRLYPPVGMMMRWNAYPEQFGDLHVPAGTRMVFAPHLLHRHPKYWDDPETFQPERWLNVSDSEWERRRFAFIPFSAGGRNCIGHRFATMEAQLVLAGLVRAFWIQMAPSQRDTNHTFTTFVTMKSKPLLKIVVQERNKK